MERFNNRLDFFSPPFSQYPELKRYKLILTYIQTICINARNDLKNPENVLGVSSLVFRQSGGLSMLPLTTTEVLSFAIICHVPIKGVCIGSIGLNKTVILYACTVLKLRKLIPVLLIVLIVTEDGDLTVETLSPCGVLRCESWN